MLNANYTQIDPDPYQGVALPANPYLTPFFALAVQTPRLARLGMDDIDAFLNQHTNTRASLSEDKRDFMKQLKREILELAAENKMPIVGVYVGHQLVSGCVVLYPTHEKVAEYLGCYDFEGKEETSAVISAVWTHPAYTGRGYSKKAVDLGMDLAVIDGKDVFRAKVDKKNEPSLKLFDGFDFDTTPEGENPQKRYPRLAL